MKEKNTLHGQMKMRRNRIWKRVLIAFAVLILILVGAFAVLRYVSYEHVNIVKTYESESSTKGHYIQYAGGVLEYSKDGVAMLKENGEEIWNHPNQMNNPFVEICKEAAVVADKGGTSILVFQKDGLKGEIRTTNPIEKVAVSAQGIVAAILMNDEIPRVMCYDAMGNVLVEHKATFTSTGYPVDVALSQDGNVLMVSYVGVQGSVAKANIVYYNFGDAGAAKDEYRVANMEYVDSIAPLVSFLNKNDSLIVTDHSFVLATGLEEPTVVKEVAIEKEIKNVAYNENLIAFLLKGNSGTGYELCVYNLEGEMLFQAEHETEYANLKVVDKKVILYEGSKCAIYNNVGVCKFEGNMELQILDIFPEMGIEKYNVISANGFQGIQLAK